MQDADLRRAILWRTRLHLADLSGADLRGADFSGLYEGNARGVRLNHAVYDRQTP